MIYVQSLTLKGCFLHLSAESFAEWKSYFEGWAYEQDHNSFQKEKFIASNVQTLLEWTL